jgi:nicotinamide phosphoribosyltransferase
MTIVSQLFAPKATDKAYTVTDKLRISMILRLDSYKFGHPFAYPEGDEIGGEIVGMTSYGTARVNGAQKIVPAGMQPLMKEFFTTPITMADVDEAEAFSEGHFGRKLFHRAGWEKVVREYGGFVPLIIRAVPEGTVIRGGLPIYTVTCLDRDLYWMSASFETLIQRGVWYPTTIATLDYETKLELKRFYELSGADMGLLPFALHDFGGRGVTCAGQAEIGGAAHLFSFMGSDTVEGVVAANHWYKSPMSAFSVYATEHAIQCSYGKSPEQQVKYIRHQIRKAKEMGITIVSIVMDGYDVYREAEACCTILRDEIIEFGQAGGKVVFRPDSGDMMEVVPRILRMQEVAFGATMTSKGYKKVNYVGIIQGDGVDRLTLLTMIGNIMTMGYSADCVIFGSGGALLQKVNRDTLKFAQKACAILVERTVMGAHGGGKVQEWVGIAKDPVTDHGKKSMEGVLTTVRSKVTGELMAARLDGAPLNEEFEDIMQLVYHTGTLYNETTLDEIRARLS